MAKKPDHLADFEADDTGGVLSNLLAEEDELDRRALWRLGSWGAGATGAVILAVMASQSSLGLKRDQVAAADLARQAQQIQLVAQGNPERGAAARRRHRYAQQRSRPAVFPRHRPGTGSRLRHRGHRPPGFRTGFAGCTAGTARPRQNPQPSPAVAPVGNAPAGAVSTNPPPPPRSLRPAPRFTSAAKDAAKTDAAKAETARLEAGEGRDWPKRTSAKAEPAKAEAGGKADTGKPERRKAFARHAADGRASR